MKKERFTVEEVLARAAELHIMLGVEGEKLTISAPDGVMTEKIRAVLREYKPELVASLQQHEQPPLCARCLDLDKDHPVLALPEPSTDDFYYCKRHHPGLQRGKE